MWFSICYIPTAGDIDREPDEPVGEGVGLMTCCGFGVPGGPDPNPLCAPPLELSLLFCPISSCNTNLQWFINKKNHIQILSFYIFCWRKTFYYVHQWVLQF